VSDIAQLVVNCRCVWEQTAADGSHCLICGDQCFLTMFDAFFYFDGKSFPCGLPLCGACGAAIGGDK
jgi:hypothetical protein